MKKVLVLGHPLVINSNRIVWNELASFDDVYVDLVVPKKWRSNLVNDVSYEYCEETDHNLSNIYPITVSFKGNGSFYFFNPIKLFKILKKNRYDIVLLTQETWSLSLFFLSILLMLTQTRYKFFIWVCQNIKKHNFYWLRYFERFNTMTVDNILGCCNETEDVIKWKGLKSAWKYFPFSYDPQKLTFNKVSDSNSLTLGYLGRISEEKGIDKLLKGFAAIREKYPHAKLLMGGSGPLVDSVKNIEGVEYLGVLSHQEVFKFYEQIDLFVLPSQTRSFWKEQFGRVIIETIASGRPIVASDSGAIPEVMGRVNMPYVFEESSIESLIETLFKCIDDIKSNKTEEIVKKSFELCESQFTHREVAKRFLRYCDE